MTFQIGDTVIIDAGQHQGRTGIVHAISGTVFYVNPKNTGDTIKPYYEWELLPYVEPPKSSKPSKLATNHVFRNLQKDVGNYQVSWQLCMSIHTDLDGFTANAKRWLKEHSNLRASTIDKADWQEVYDYFKGQL